LPQAAAQLERSRRRKDIVTEKQAKKPGIAVKRPAFSPITCQIKYEFLNKILFGTFSSMFHRVLALLLLLQGIFANASRPPHHLELPNFFNRKTLSKNSNSGVAAQDLIAFGKKARKGQFPFIASLLKPSFSGAGFFHSCTGSLIASNLVLTAGKHLEYYFP